MGDVAIKVEGLSKRYRIGARRYKHDTLRDQLVAGLQGILRRGGAAASEASFFWALKDVSFDVRQGEVLGLVGRNGAGKSTLLKVLSRITEPTGGRVEIRGRVGSLLEVGTGFDRELTGRENIYLSGAILGMRKAEIDRKFDDIVAFSEVEKFIDTPVKRYSSGMYVRLAFAVAAHLEPEILLVDEVLAVGDAAFQRKCLGKMDAVTKDGGRTILFVSHNMAAVAHLCAQALWIDGGQVRYLASPDQVIAAYLASSSREEPHLSFRDRPEQAPGSDTIRLLEVSVVNDEGRFAASLDSRHPFVVEVVYEVLKRSASLRVGCRLVSSDGIVILSTNDMDSTSGERDRAPGVYVNRCRFPGEFLNNGRYFVSVGADTPMVQSHFNVEREISFTIEQAGGAGSQYSDGRAGFIRVPLDWDVRREG